jgi:hypothetical protein
VPPDVRRVLIVSPHFPPVNAPDMQRVRMSLPYFSEFGWLPFVLAVKPSAEQCVEPLLEKTVPRTIPIVRVPAFSPTLSRRIGVGNPALRALPWLLRAGGRLITEHQIDLVYFSTTMFFSMPLARVWRYKYGVPYVLDIQDPWRSDYYDNHPEHAKPPKYSIMRRVHRILESWTMKKVGGLIAVSEPYIDTLRARYPWTNRTVCATIPFAASAADFDIISALPQANSVFRPGDGAIHGTYVGRAGDDMKTAFGIIFDALRVVAQLDCHGLGALKLHFVGTSYATDDRARKTVAPVASACGVADLVSEQTERVPYFQALQLLKDADFNILVGSDDPHYVASKVHPYLMAGRPILAVVHERSGLVPVLRESCGVTLITFGEGREAVAVGSLVAAWPRLLAEIRSKATSVRLPAQYSAREMTRQQCVVFDQVIANAKS